MIETALILVVPISIFGFMIFWAVRNETAEKTRRTVIQEEGLAERSRMAKQIDYLVKKEEAQTEIRRLEMELKASQNTSEFDKWAEKLIPVLQPHLSKLLNKNDDNIPIEVLKSENDDSSDSADDQQGNLNSSLDVDSDVSEQSDLKSSSDVDSKTETTTKVWDKNPEFLKMAENGELDEILKTFKPLIPKKKL